MVLINGLNYACARCVRGHRASQCMHTEQTLRRMRPKGRPATHCGHCRDSRWLKNTHIKCACGRGPSSTCQCQITKLCTCTSKAKTRRASVVLPADDTPAPPEVITAGDYHKVLATVSAAEPPPALPKPGLLKNATCCSPVAPADYSLPLERNSPLDTSLPFDLSLPLDLGLAPDPYLSLGANYDELPMPIDQIEQADTAGTEPDGLSPWQDGSFSSECTDFMPSPEDRKSASILASPLDGFY